MDGLNAQQRGPIVDYFGDGPEVEGFVPDGEGGFKPGTYRLALCVCAHGKKWPEGDRFEGQGGEACRECSEAAAA